MKGKEILIDDREMIPPPIPEKVKKEIEKKTKKKSVSNKEFRDYLKK